MVSVNIKSDTMNVVFPRICLFFLDFGFNFISPVWIL